MPPDGQIDFSLGILHDSPHQGKIAFADVAVFELSGQTLMGNWRFGNDHDTRGILVKAMNDSRPYLTAKCCQIGAMVQQTVDQRTRRVSWCRVNHKTRRFVDDDQRSVFMDNVQIDGFGQKLSGFRLRQMTGDMIFDPDPIGGFTRLQINENGTLLDQLGRV